jgi:hypothetical protein
MHMMKRPQTAQQAADNKVHRPDSTAQKEENLKANKKADQRHNLGALYGGQRVTVMVLESNGHGVRE